MWNYTGKGMIKAENLADVTEITERQKMAVWLSLQVLVGNMTEKEALIEAEKFNKWMTEQEKLLD